MKRVKISRWLASAAVCSLLLATGCAPSGESVATLTLKLNPQDSTTYRVISETERSIKWEGSLPEDPTFKGGRNHNRVDMTFTQEIQGVDNKGNAIAKIIFKELKCSSTVKSSSDFEFDSSQPKDPDHPMAKLIGKSYTIKITPTGEVTEVIDIKEAETAARMGSVVPRRALRLLKSEAIKARHGTLVLPDTNKNQLRIGDNWSRTKAFYFGMMGSESYEKIYTLNKIKGQDNQQIAIIDMNAIPASEALKGQAVEFLKESDSTKTYTGKLELNLTTGKVKKYFEKLQQEWTVAVPSTEQGAESEPVILTMSATHLYSLEKID